MYRMKTGFIALCCMMGLAISPASHAQFAVVDVGAIAQLIEQVRTLQEQLTTARDQLTQARTQYESMTGGRGMERLLAGTTRNYLPADWQALEAALRGVQGGYAALAGDLDAAIRNNAILTPEQLARISLQEREQLEAARRSVALFQVTSRQALEASSQRFTSLQRLIDAIPTATDTKAALDLQARIAAEQTMLQNENTKLMVLHQATQAEERALQQRARELAIANIGSLRRLPPIGLND